MRLATLIDHCTRACCLSLSTECAVWARAARASHGHALRVIHARASSTSSVPLADLACRARFGAPKPQLGQQRRGAGAPCCAGERRADCQRRARRRAAQPDSSHRRADATLSSKAAGRASVVLSCIVQVRPPRAALRTAGEPRTVSCCCYCSRCTCGVGRPGASEVRGDVVSASVCGAAHGGSVWEAGLEAL